MQRCRVRSAWMCRCWRTRGAVVFAVTCSRPGIVMMGAGVGLV